MNIPVQPLGMKILLRTYYALRQLGRSLIVESPFVHRLFIRVVNPLEETLSLYWLRHMVPNPFSNAEHTLFYRPEDHGVILPILLHGEYDPETTQCLKKILRPGMGFVDAGAHIGSYTLLAARIVGPEGRVYAFEPVPSTFEILVQNIRTNGYDGIAFPIPKAVLNRRGRVKVFSDKRDTVTATLFPGNRKRRGEEVESVTLDEFFRDANWPSIHVVKINIEGAELKALEGMKELSARNPTLQLIIELCLRHLSRAGVTLEQLFEALRNTGFSQFHLLWDRGNHLQIPRDISRLAALTHHGAFNLLCEK